MKTTKAIETLVLELNQQTLIAEAAEARAKELKAQLFALMQEAEETKLETVNGKAVIVETRDFDLTGFPEVAEAEAAAKQAKEKAKETAPFALKHTLRFTPNRGFEPPAPKTKKAWKTRIVTAPAAV